MFKHHQVNPPLFDIKLKSPYKDLIYIRGNEYECDPVVLEGSVKLSLPEDTHVRKIKLHMIGEYNVEYFQRETSGMISSHFIERYCILHVEWNNLLNDAEGKIFFGDYGDGLMKYHKLESAKKAHAKDEHSVKVNPDGGDRRTQDRQNLPARPGFSRMNSMPTSDRPVSSLLRVPESGIDETPFKNKKVSSQHSFLLPKGNYNLPFKVVLPANIPETIEGLKCGSILYKLSCSIERGIFEKSFHKSKHIRVIRTLHPQNLNLVDNIDIENTWPGKLQYSVSVSKKGIAIGSNISLIVLIVPLVKGLRLKNIHAEIVQRYCLTHDVGRSPEFENAIGRQALAIPNPDDLGQDSWRIKTSFKVPESLKELTQSCCLKNNYVDVKHRLRISIKFKNKEGHVSEIKANLPIHVYISATTGYVYGRNFDIKPNHGYIVPDDTTEILLFRKGKGHYSASQSPALTPIEGQSDAEKETNEEPELSAPPLYQQHFFDKVYDSSLPQSPLEQFRVQSAGNSPLNSLPGSLSSMKGYFDLQRNIDDSLLSSSFTSKPPPIETLSKVPSYNEAIDEEEDESEEMAPMYDGSVDNIRSSVSSLSLRSSETHKHKHSNSLHMRPNLRKGSSTGNLFFGRNYSKHIDSDVSSSSSSKK